MSSPNTVGIKKLSLSCHKTENLYILYLVIINDAKCKMYFVCSLYGMYTKAYVYKNNLVNQK